MDFALGFIVGLAFPYVLAFAVITVLAIGWCLSGEEASWGWASFLLILLLGVAYVRLEPTTDTLLYVFAAWVAGALVHAPVRIVWQAKKLRSRVEEAMEKTYNWPSRVEIDTKRLDFTPVDYRDYGRKDIMTFESPAAAREYFRPKLGQHRGLIVGGYMAGWPLYAIQTITVDLMEMLHDVFAGMFQRIANSAYGG